MREKELPCATDAGLQPQRDATDDLEPAAPETPTHGVPEQVGDQRAADGGEQRPSEAQLPESGQGPDSKEERRGRNRHTHLNGEHPDRHDQHAVPGEHLECIFHLRIGSGSPLRLPSAPRAL